VVEVDFQPDSKRSVLLIQSRAVSSGRTGVEMEALVAVSAAALTIYDMAKAIDRAMTIEAIRLVRKSGGRSGDFVREGELEWR
jgi:cyclic pyranopterin phosphate synthase